MKRVDCELGILITVRNKPALVGEVKWGKVSKKDVSKFLEKAEGFSCRKVMVTKSAFKTDEVEVITPAQIGKMVNET